VRREFSAGGVVLRRMRGRWFVAVARPQGRPAGTWVLPKGLIDPGERGVEAAVRETFEETGVHGVVVRKLGDTRYVYTWEGERVFKVVSFFLLRWTGGRIGALPPGMEVEVAEARWLPLEEATGALRHRSEREMVERAAGALHDL
jgi:8-oxo-dGTP pyrophosphatase MutT (NUDIX family)